MQKSLPILGLFAILIVGLTTPAMAEYDEWDDKYKQLEDEFEEKRHQIEKEFDEKYDELDKHYEDSKAEIYEKTDNSDLSYSEIDAMFYELFLEFEEKERILESEMIRQFDELDESFENELRNLDEQSRQHYDEYERDDGEFYENDPEWKSIEPLANRIMELVPMEKIQRLWEVGEIDQLVELIVSETDLSYEEAKRVVVFFEKYEDKERDEDYYEDDYREYDYREYDVAGNPKYDEREYDEDHYEDNYREYDFEEYEYTESYPTDNEQIFRLEQRIVELEEENKMLLETIEELEEKIIQVNAVLMEQVKFIYEWVQSQ